MTQIATVERLLGDGRAELMVRRQSACGHNCASCGGCGPESATRVTVLAENAPGAGVGDTVRVESESSRVLGMAAVLYILPLFLLFVGYFAASGLLNLGEGGSLAVGLGCMVVGFGAALGVDRRVRAGHPMQFRIVEVMRSCSDM